MCDTALSARLASAHAARNSTHACLSQGSYSIESEHGATRSSATERVGFDECSVERQPPAVATASDG